MSPDFFFLYDSCTSHAEEAYPHIKANNVTSHDNPRTTYYTWYSSVVCCLAAHLMVVSLHQYLHVLVLHRSLAVLRPSQVFHDILCDRRIMFAIFLIVAYRT